MSKSNDQRNRTAATQQRQISPRELALQVLMKVADEGAYSNLKLNQFLQNSNLSRQDAALATELVYGTISHQLTIDYWLQQFVTKGFHKLERWVLSLLRLSVYQLLWLDRVPAHAVVNEAVKIAKKKGHQGISSMVNGVLRNVDRNRAKLNPASIQLDDAATTISVRYSFPLWLVKRWMNDYGVEQTELICKSSNEPPHNSIRVNQLRTSPDHIIEKLVSQNIQALPSNIASSGVVVKNGGNMAQTDEFEEGLWSLQDESSMLVAEVVAPKPGMKVLDACAAPGGKSMHLAELMHNEGTLISNDLHEHKRNLMEEQAKRLGLTNINVTVGDAALLPQLYSEQFFDAVLLDAPCSGLGVVRRKPEIKWTKSEDDITSIAVIQKTLLEAVSNLVKVNGVLVYSTCTIAKEENEDQIEAFLHSHPQFILDSEWPSALLNKLKKSGLVTAQFNGQLQIMPYCFNSDGFYIAKLKRIKE